MLAIGYRMLWEYDAGLIFFVMTYKYYVFLLGLIQTLLMLAHPHSTALATKLQCGSFMGLVLLSLSMGSFYMTFDLYRNMGSNSFEFLCCTFIFFTSFTLFLYNENKVKNPLIDLKVFRIISFSIHLIIIFVAGMGVFSSNLIIPFYLMETLHYTPGQVGVALLPIGLVLIFTCPIASILSDKVAPPIIIKDTSDWTGKD